MSNNPIMRELKRLAQFRYAVSGVLLNKKEMLVNLENTMACKALSIEYRKEDYELYTTDTLITHAGELFTNDFLQLYLESVTGRKVETDSSYGVTIKL